MSARMAGGPSRSGGDVKKCARFACSLNRASGAPVSRRGRSERMALTGSGEVGATATTHAGFVEKKYDTWMLIGAFDQIRAAWKKTLQPLTV